MLNPNERRCTVCQHAKRSEVEAALLAGDSQRNIANRFGLSSAAVQRHKKHIAELIAEAAQVVEQPKREFAQKVAEQRRVRTIRAVVIQAQLEELQATTLDLLEKARREGNDRIALAAIKEVRANLESLGRFCPDMPSKVPTDDVPADPRVLVIAQRVRELETMPEDQFRRLPPVQEKAAIQ